MKNKNFSTNLIIITLFLITSVSCNQVLRNTQTPSTSKIQITVSNSTIEANSSVTLNIVFESFSAEKITWKASSGQISSANGLVTRYTAPNRPGSYIIEATASGNSELVTTNLTITVISEDTIPPSVPQNLKVTPTDNTLILTWNQNAESDLGGYKLYYSTITSNFENVVDMGLVTEYSLTNLENHKTYYLAISAYDKSNNKNTSAPSGKAIGIPNDNVAPSTPLMFKVELYNDKSVKLSWLNPTDKDFAGIKILKKENSFPKNYIEGELIAEITASENMESFIDKNVTSGSVYYYSIFAYDENPLFAEPATKSIVILP